MTRCRTLVLLPVGVLAALALQPRAASAQIPGDSAAPQLLFPGDSVALATSMEGGRLVVRASIGGEGPYSFFVDTGAGASVIDADLATELGLETIGTAAVGAPGGAPVQSSRVLIPALRVGDLEIRGVQAAALGLRKLTSGVMDGVLGMDLFRDVLLTLDPREQRAVVSRGALSAGQPGVISILDGGRLAFDVDVAGRSVQMDVDTGAPGGFTLPIELIDRLPHVDQPERTGGAQLVGGSRTLRIRRLDGAIRFAGLEYTNPEIAFIDPSPGVGNIGSAIMNDLTLTIDLRNRLIRFDGAAVAGLAGRGPERPSGAAPSPATPRRLGVRFQGTPDGGFTAVASVDPGSLGERVGFQAGDLLISLNGRPMSEYDPSSLGELIRGTEPLLWEIERAGVRRRLEVR